MQRQADSNLGVAVGKFGAGQRIAVTGANGGGKTTLVRTICGKLEPVSGSLRLGANVRLGYMTQEQELLDPKLSPLQTIQKVSSFNETEARHFLHFFLFSGDDPLRPCGEMSYGERARLMLKLGVDAMIAQPFDRTLANTSAAEFIGLLKKRLGFERLLIGYDFALGKGREGDAARLAAMGSDMGYAVEVIPALSDESGVISSTEIRKLVAFGNVAEAAVLLGHC